MLQQPTKRPRFTFRAHSDDSRRYHSNYCNYGGANWRAKTSTDYWV